MSKNKKPIQEDEKINNSFIKNFVEWFQKKPIIDNKEDRLRFKEREVWYIHFGTNIGFELDGKEEFLRPCLVIKKLSNETLYVIPLTSKKKNGTWYFPSNVGETEGRYIFSQMRSIDSKRLKYYVETVSKKEFSTIKTSFISFFET